MARSRRRRRRGRAWRWWLLLALLGGALFAVLETRPFRRRTVPAPLATSSAPPGERSAPAPPTHETANAPPRERPHADIDDASRAELERVLREAEREEARRR